MTQLYIQHKEMRESGDGQSEKAQELFKNFLREVESMRPLFTMASAMQVSRFYCVQLRQAMEYFGVTNDQMYRQLLLMLGKEEVNKGMGFGRRCLLKTDAKKSRDLSASEHLKANHPNVSPHKMTNPFYRPTEFPAPPERLDTVKGYPSDVVKTNDVHRGHWVLTEPELVLTNEALREDPW